MLGPILFGERVRLGAPDTTMLPTFIRWLADPDVSRYLGMGFPPSEAMEQEWFDRTARSEADIVWAVWATDQGDGPKLIGTTGIHRIDWRNRNAITGNLIGEKSEWGKGYGSEVVALRTRYAFEQLNLEKVMTEAFTENRGSIRALEKAGYRQNGVKRRHVYRHGRWHDFWTADLLREEWEAAQRGRPEGV
jgi:RimJ/RimL family protein N-acetyltransferase